MPATAVLALGAVGAVPPGVGVVEGGQIPYKPEALATKKKNQEDWINRDPEIKCYMPGVPRANYMPFPFQIVQGENDQYGTLRQIEVAQQECYCPVEVALLPDTRHAPYREAPEATLRAIADFANRLLRDHHEGDMVTETELRAARVRSL